MSKIISTNKNQIVLSYKPYGGSVYFIVDKFNSNDNYVMDNCLQLKKEDLLYDIDYNDDTAEFIIGYNNNSLQFLKKEIFNTKKDIIFDKDINLNTKMLGIGFGFNIFLYLQNILNEPQIKVLKSEKDGSIPYDVYLELVSKFPNKYEWKLYKASRVQNILDDYINLKKDFQKQYNSYLNKKKSSKDCTKSYLNNYSENELSKYKRIENDLSEMLEKENICEQDWQSIILSIVLLLYPKYITYIKEFSFKDVINCTSRRIDIALIDDNGYIDFIEIKKPNDFHLLHNTEYRDNFQPSRALAGAIMQAEKYIYYLSHLGKSEIDKLPTKSSDREKLEKLSLKLKINNPKIYIIAGRTNEYSEKQLLDLEIIKRKYKNVLDIISYDDILSRLRKQILVFSEVKNFQN